MIFSLRIKDERLKRNLTQREFGKFLGVSGTMIMYYEQGKKSPSVEQLLIISERLQKDVNYLLGQEYTAKTTTEDYTIRLSKNEIQVINELRKQPKMYRKLIEEPKRTVDLLALKFNK